MVPDYYFLLRVSPDADAATIKAAYRRRAKECHPDRGGRHKEMVLVNEAWEILGDPERRRRYDESRSVKQTQPDAPVSQDVAAARARASEYPVKWSDFERWLDGASQDFQAAEWAMTKFMGCEIPLTRRSASAKIFLATGAVIGGFSATGMVFLPRKAITQRSSIKPPFGNSPQFTHQAPSPSWLTFLASLLLIITYSVIGAWVGKWVHGQCSRLLTLRKKIN